VGEGVEDSVQRRFSEALERWRAAGARLVDITLPHARHAIPVYYLIATAEASSNLARYDGVRYGHRATLGKNDGLQQMYDRTRDEGFGAEVKRRIMLGTYVLSAGYYDAYYAQAQRVRGLIAQDFRYVFQSGVDAIFTPTTPTPAFRIGEHTDDPYEMYLSDVFTVTANLVGIPALSLPIGTVDGLPVGGQLMGRHWDEERILRVARALESAQGA
jgi:aspartyl-tRNA(Asn)/glutamyl-tRNA(Gln) amidotransferase subunit A